MERTEDSAFGPLNRIGQLAPRNLDLADSGAKLEQYVGLGLPGQVTDSAPQLIGATAAGGADAIASRGAARADELLDRAAMQLGAARPSTTDPARPTHE